MKTRIELLSLTTITALRTAPTVAYIPSTKICSNGLSFASKPKPTTVFRSTICSFSASSHPLHLRHNQCNQQLRYKFPWIRLVRQNLLNQSITKRFASLSSAGDDLLDEDGDNNGDSTIRRSSLTEERMKSEAIHIIQSAISAVDPYNSIRSFVQKDGDLLVVGNTNEKETFEVSGDEQTQQIKSYDLSKDFDKVVLVAFGKASSAMATAVVQQMVGDGIDDDNDRSLDMISKIISGIVICKDGHATTTEHDFLTKHAPNIQIVEASHPVPDQRSVNAAQSLLDHVKDAADPRTLVICCISGGGSALFCSPSEGLGLDDLQAVNSLLLASGMPITDMNVIRKRLERGKGGKLAMACSPSTVITLVLSDVIGDPLDLIASGPTVADTSTGQDAWRIVNEFDLLDKLPTAVVDILREARDDSLRTPAAGERHPVFKTSQTVLVGNNRIAVESAAMKAKRFGYNPVILGTEIDGEAKEIARVYVAMAKHLKTELHRQRSSKDDDKGIDHNAFTLAPSLPVALIAGGETTVTLHSDETTNGKGGRNQELALSAGIMLESLNLRNVILASAGTDGGDGPTDAAGAIVDSSTIYGTRDDALNALTQHNAYPYLDGLGQQQTTSGNRSPTLPLIKTGATGTNVADVCVVLVGDDVNNDTADKKDR